MNRILKILGLALAAAVTTSALAASSAQALKFKAGEGKATAYVTGTQITHNSKSLHVFATKSLEISCSEASFVGEMEGESKILTITATYNKCSAGTFPVVVNMNGCDFDFYGGEEITKNHFAGSSMDIVCPEGKEILFVVYGSHQGFTENNPRCVYQIAPQIGLTANTFTNTAGPPADVDMTTQFFGVPYQVTGSMLVCGTNGKGNYTGGTTLKAYSNAAHTTQIGLEVIP